VAAARRKLDQAATLRQLETAADAARKQAGGGGNAGSTALRIDATHRLIAETQVAILVRSVISRCLQLRGPGRCHCEVVLCEVAGWPCLALTIDFVSTNSRRHKHARSPV